MKSPKSVQKALSQAIAKLHNEERIEISEKPGNNLGSIYIIALDSGVWDCKKCSAKLGENYIGRQGFYIGYTMLLKMERIEQHAQGIKSSRVTKHHFQGWADWIEPLAPDGYSLEKRLTEKSAKYLEQLVIPTALRVLGFAAYAGYKEELEDTLAGQRSNL
jgi:hypothetical protein